MSRARKFFASWLHIYRTQQYVKRPSWFGHVRMTTRVWRTFGYGKDFHLG